MTFIIFVQTKTHRTGARVGLVLGFLARRLGSWPVKVQDAILARLPRRRALRGVVKLVFPLASACKISLVTEVFDLQNVGAVQYAVFGQVAVQAARRQCEMQFRTPFDMRYAAWVLRACAQTATIPAYAGTRAEMWYVLH